MQAPCGKPAPMIARCSLLAAGLASLLAACSGASASARPAETLRAYSEAVQAGRARQAYDLLSAEAKKALPYQDFDRMLKENPQELRELAEALQRPAEAPRVTATVTPPGGPSLLLVYENGAWRIDGSSIDLYSQATPERAVAAFVRAYENKRFDVLLRFVPDAQKKGLSVQSLEKAWSSDQREEMERVVQALKMTLPTARFELLGERATLAFGSGGTLEMLREQGAWKIEDLR
ncbi:MAG TPA: hypothetical protein VER33_01585 [Polyangiaceae bacterium]|nr:hypothetical protein [Polyangiaceae bacterium]